ncbi:hypothetical protein PG997_011609 [Apiospora hydei]|uniref:Uncharacterized protein n=1 Tax=Apiospora hydei TaxID=1337664 RepID=A0ABR1VM81_9PEZI
MGVCVSFANLPAAAVTPSISMTGSPDVRQHRLRNTSAELRPARAAASGFSYDDLLTLSVRRSPTRQIAHSCGSNRVFLSTTDLIFHDAKKEVEARGECLAS